MIVKNIIYYIRLGINQLRYNTNYLLAAMLLLVLPAVFVWVAQYSFQGAYGNVVSAQHDAIEQLHDMLRLQVTEVDDASLLQKYVETLVEQTDVITQARILSEVDNELVIEQSAFPEEVGLTAGDNQLYVPSAIVPGETFLFQFSRNSQRVEHGISTITHGKKTSYIFTEHSYGATDALMIARQQQVYLALPIIYLFLLALSVWLIKLTNWQKQYHQTKKKLDEQMLFTNSVAHELRAPLTAVRGYLSFLRESKNLSSEEQVYAKNINTATERLIRLINDFLEVARIQSGNLKLQFKETEIKNIIKAVQTEFQQLALQKKLDLQVELPDKPVIAETDSARLQQVLTNLVSNAIKYTDQGRVSVALQQTKLRTFIIIKDTGHGISAEDQKKLFGAFTRVGGADTGHVTGTGLGMWITKQLVELLHGTIEVESIEGVGTHIKLSFDV
jgi:signal transduction histidine kinase